MHWTRIAVVLLWVCLIRVAAAQCEGRWIGMDSSITPTVTFPSGIFTKQATWDPDGAGPQTPWLIVGGNFTGFGTPAANYIAGWDGTNWHNFAGGFNERVRALGTYQGQLIAAGLFTATQGDAPLSHIARWNGVTWQPLGTGVTDPSSDATIWCMTEMPDGLYVGGVFNSIGGMAASNIARWDGAAWHAVGSGLDGEVDDLLEFQGELYAAGLFAHSGAVAIAGVGHWHGSAWAGSGTAAGTTANALEVYQGRLHALLKTLDSNGQPVVFLSDLESSGWQSILTDQGAKALRAFQGELYLGGYGSPFAVLGAPDQTGFSSGLLRWNGTAATPLRCKFLSPPQDAMGTSSYVSSFVQYQGMLSISGTGYAAVNSGLSAFEALHDGHNWKPLPGEGATVGDVTDSLVSQDQLIVAGNFLQFKGLAANNVIAWNGRDWQTLGNGLPGYPAAIANWNGRAVIAGRSDVAVPGQKKYFVVCWNGANWDYIGEGFDNFISCLAVYRGELYAGGDFSTIQNRHGDAIKKWTGTQWQTVGSTTAHVTAPTVPYSYIPVSLFVFQDVLYNYGWEITSSNYQYPGQEPRLEMCNGTDWVYLGSNYPAKTIDDGNLLYQAWAERYGQSYQAFAGVGEDAVHVTRLSSLGYCLPSGGSAWDLALDSDNRLVVGGRICTLDGQTPAGGVARWDQSAFHSLGGGVSTSPVSSINTSGSVYTLAKFRNELVAGGSFSYAEGAPAFNIARWTDTGLITFAQQPAPTAACPGGDAAFSALPASGYGDDTLTYRWLKDGALLTDGPLASGAIVRSSSTLNLTISSVTVAEVGDYACEVTDACGPATSNAATLSIRRPYARECGGPGCEPDLNADGNVDEGDIAYLINIVAGGENPAAADPDFNQDGNADEGDIDALIGVVAGEPCP
ncbi:MAG: hypothetical protein WC718_13220 [Phycisphaerales bacterium]